jgi:transcriptional regulator with XRE-family HTH domain
VTEIGALLREARASRSIYQVERESHIPHSSISKAERGVMLPTFRLLERLAAYYQCPDDLHTWLQARARDRIAAYHQSCGREVMSAVAD